MIQVQTSVINVPSANGIVYGQVWMGRPTLNNTIGRIRQTQPEAGTFRNARMRIGTALTGSMTIVATLMVNGSASAIALTFNSGSGVEITDTSSVTVADGDTIEWEFNRTNTPTSQDVQVSIDFEPTTGDISCHGFGNVNFLGTAPTRDSLLWGGQWNIGNTWQADSVNTEDIIAQPGTITKMRIRLSNAPGGGNTRVFTIYKNGTAQDGSGGTPDTRVTFGAADTAQTANFSLSVAAGDFVYVRHTVTGAPSTGHSANGTIAFSSSTPLSWNYGATHFESPSVSTVQYTQPYGTSTSYTNSPESSRQHKNGPTAFSLSGLRLRATTAPGSGNSYEWMGRHNTADSAQSVTLSNTDLTVGPSMGASIDLADGDLLSMRSTPTSSPTQPGTHSWAFVAVTAAPPVRAGAIVLGGDLTVSADRALGVNLDGGTNTHDTPGMMKVFGDLHITGNFTAGGTASFDASAALDALGT